MGWISREEVQGALAQHSAKQVIGAPFGRPISQQEIMELTLKARKMA